jgi:DNA-binding transcriptional regulator YiaG
MKVTEAGSNGTRTQRDKAAWRKAFAKELTRARTEAKLSKNDMSVVLSVSATRVAQWERGQGLPSMQRYRALRVALPKFACTLPGWLLRAGRMGGIHATSAKRASTVGRPVDSAPGNRARGWSRTLLKTLVDVAKNDETMAVLQALLRAARAEKMSLDDLLDVLWGDIE